MGLQARLMSQALRKITGALSNSGTTAIFINQLREKIGVMFGSPETTTGGRALKFYSSVRLDVRRIETLKDGTVRIIKGEMTGVALTSEPAIRSARVAEVAATEGDEEISDSTIEPDATPTEKDDEVEQTVTPAEAVETVEAAQSVTANAKPAVGGWTSKPRLEFTAAKYLENTIRASLGEESARQYVAAADDTTDNAGLVPTRQLTEVINGLANTTRSSIDAISRGVLPEERLHQRQRNGLRYRQWLRNG